MVVPSRAVLQGRGDPPLLAVNLVAWDVAGASWVHMYLVGKECRWGAKGETYGIVSSMRMADWIAMVMTPGADVALLMTLSEKAGTGKWVIVTWHLKTRQTEQLALAPPFLDLRGWTSMSTWSKG